MTELEKAELRKQVARRQEQWDAFHRWEAEQPPDERSPAEIIADIGAIWDWMPAEDRTRDPDPAKKGVQALHAALKLLKCNQ